VDGRERGLRNVGATPIVKGIGILSGS